MCICEEWFSQARIDSYYYDICIFRILWKRNAKQGNVNICLIWSNIVSFKKWLRQRQNIIEGCKPHPDVNLGPKLFEHSSSGSNLGLWSFFFFGKRSLKEPAFTRMLVMVYTMSWTSLDQQNVVWFTFADQLQNSGNAFKFTFQMCI